MSRSGAATILSCSLLFGLPGLSGFASAADLLSSIQETPTQNTSFSAASVTGHVTVLDGRTLWFPASRRLVRLAAIDSCELPQWAFDPKATQQYGKALMPVPCGGFAKAWLKRTIASRAVSCQVVASWTDKATGEPMEARCVVNGQDLALSMLKAGWAMSTGHDLAPARYATALQYAMSARQGIWSTYVLDPSEWREKAIDKTVGRQPFADRNLLSERRREISPTFVDAVRQPPRRDR